MGILDHIKATEAYLMGVTADSVRAGEAAGIEECVTGRVPDVFDGKARVCFIVKFADKSEMAIPISDVLAGKYKVLTDEEVETAYRPKVGTE